jgi:hypothetical protein
VTATAVGGWSAAASVPAYQKDLLGFVRLRGSFSGGTSGTVVFYLPANYLPAQTITEVGVSSSGSPVAWTVYSSGEVVATFAAALAGTISLDGVSFLADGSAAAAVYTSAPTSSSAGPVTAGTVLTASAGTYSGSGTVSYQWLTCDAAGSDCSAASGFGATTASYTTAASDGDHTLVAQVTITSSGVSVSAVTAPVTVSVTANSVYEFAGAGGDLCANSSGANTSNCGDGGFATEASFQNTPGDVVVSPAGNSVYMLDYQSSAGGWEVIRKLNPVSGIISVFAGTRGSACASAVAAGTTGVCGVGGPAANASLSTISSNPTTGSLAVDAANDVFIASTTCVQEVAGVSGTQFGQSMTAGDLYVIAGTCNGAGSTTPLFTSVSALAVDLSGNLYVADSSLLCVKEVALASGTVSAFAGACNSTSGSAGDGGPAAAATFANGLGGPNALAWTSGGLVISDSGNAEIREVASSTCAAGSSCALGVNTTAGDIYHIAGVSGASSSISGNGGSVLAANLGTITSLAVGPDGNIYVMANPGQSGQAVIRYFLPGGNINALNNSSSSAYGASVANWSFLPYASGYFHQTLSISNAGAMYVDDARTTAGQAFAVDLLTAPTTLTTAAPTISGVFAVGNVLTAADTTSGATNYSYQWQDCTSTSVGSCTNVAANGTSSTYTVISADTDSYLGVVVSALNRGGAGVSAFTTTLSVPVNTAVPTVSPTFGIQMGNVVSATTGSWSPAASSYAYQWLDCNSSGGACVNATGAGATTSSYTTAAADYGFTLVVAVIATNASGSSVVADSVYTNQVLGKPVNQTAPSISGTAAGGSTLTANPGTWSGYPSYSYQWYDCTAVNDSGTCTAATGSGAQSASYTLNGNDATGNGGGGFYVYVSVLAMNSTGNQGAAAYDNTLVTVGPAPTNSAPPSFSPTTGLTASTSITGSAGTWSTTTTYTYQLEKCSTTATGSCTADTNATASGSSASTTLAGLKIGSITSSHIALLVTATNANTGGSASVFSTVTASAFT